MVASAGSMVPPLPPLAGRGGDRAQSARGPGSPPAAADAQEAAREGAQTTRVFRRVGGGYEETNADGSPVRRSPSPRRLHSPRPPADCFGVGTQGLGSSCNESLDNFERNQRRRWLEVRTKQLAQSQAVARSKPPQESPRERMSALKQKQQRSKELAEEELEKRSSAFARENRRLREQLKEAREAALQETVHHVQELKQRRGQCRRNVWCYVCPTTGTWEEFPAAQCELLEQARAEERAEAELPADTLFPAAAAAAAGGTVLVDLQRGTAELRGDPEAPVITVRRRAALRQPGDGGSEGRQDSPSGEGLQDQLARDAAELSEEVLQKVRQRRDQLQQMRQRLRSENKAREERNRELAKRERERQKQRWDQAQRGARDWREKLGDRIKDARRAEEQQRKDRQQFLEQTQESLVRGLKRQRAEARARRQEYDEANMASLKKGLDQLRREHAEALHSSKARCQEEAPLDGDCVQLSRAQWHSRAAHLAEVRAQRERRTNAMRDRELDREAELSRCAELREGVLAGVSRRRARGILGGGGGLGERSGGVVEVSPPRGRVVGEEEED